MNQSDLSAHDYQQSVASEGSSLYYATLYYPEDMRSALIILHAFYAEIQHIIQSCSDPGLARIKLQWWREELQYCKQQRARHPLAKHLSTIIEQYQIDESSLSRIIDTTENLIHPQYQYEAERLEDLQYGLAAVWRIASQLSCERKQEESEAISQAACVIQTIQQTISFFEDQAKGRCYFSEEHLRKYQLQQQELSTMDNTTVWTQLLQPSFLELQRILKKQSQSLQQQQPFLLGQVLSHIYLVILKKPLTSSKPMHPDSYQIMPIQKLWYAWRSYKRFGVG